LLPEETVGKSTGKLENPVDAEAEGGIGSEDEVAEVDAGTTTTC